MKKIIIYFLLVTISLNSYSEDIFYYYKDTKIFLKSNNGYAYLLTDIQNQNELQKKLNGIATIKNFHQDIYQNRLIKTFQNSDRKIANSNNYYAEIQFANSNMTDAELNQVLNQFMKESYILHASKSYDNVSKERVSITNYVWVGLRDVSDIQILKTEASKINYTIVGQNPFMPEFVMLCPNGNVKGNQVVAAQKLFETHLFNSCEPELIGEIRTNCTNDPLFNNQWGLNNTGQLGGTVGMDTRVCGAYAYTTGSNNVDIAIIDEGFENNHPDLSGNLENNGYNAMTATSPTGIYGSHGTACAGIAAASGNNNLGVTGVAYNADLMSVSVQFGGGGATWAQFADAFNWARTTGGAEVLSNSWGWNNPNATFDAAVTNALTLGRGGLGCVILFASGNGNLSSLPYPNNSNAGIINVGAMSQCGERKNPSSCDGENWWGSNYGTGIDVMAPGVKIQTTDRQGANGYNTASGAAGDYYATFNGTSSACPHAAGVAALILSANPCLTQAQVQEIMKRTARKVGGYSYGGALPDGSWNNEMGHGLLDAEAAVRMASTKYLQNLTISGTATYKGWFIAAGYNVNPFIPVGNFVTNSGANVNIKAKYEIDFQTGCDLNGTVDAVIVDPGACNTW